MQVLQQNNRQSIDFEKISSNRQVLGQIDSNIENVRNIQIDDYKLAKIQKPVAEKIEKQRVDYLNFDDILPCDKNDINDPQKCVQYIRDIILHLRGTEFKAQADPEYIQHQSEVTTNMRAILLDWIFDVHHKFKLNQETLYLTVNLIDRFLSNVNIPKSQLQLLGVTALMIACKYEEIYYPKVSKFLTICAGIYSKDNILDMEASLLNTINYEVTVPTQYQFLKRFLHICNACTTAKFIAFYLSELSLMSFSILRFNCSTIAASCVYLAMKLTTSDMNWDKDYANYIEYTFESLKDCILDLSKLAISQENFMELKLNTCSKKYARPRRLNVSQFVPSRIASLKL